MGDRSPICSSSSSVCLCLISSTSSRSLVSLTRLYRISSSREQTTPAHASENAVAYPYEFLLAPEHPAHDWAQGYSGSRYTWVFWDLAVSVDEGPEDATYISQPNEVSYRHGSLVLRCRIADQPRVDSRRDGIESHTGEAQRKITGCPVRERQRYYGAKTALCCMRTWYVLFLSWPESIQNSMCDDHADVSPDGKRHTPGDPISEPCGAYGCDHSDCIRRDRQDLSHRGLIAHVLDNLRHSLAAKD